MFEVPIPENIKKFKGTFLLGLSYRQFFIAALLISYAITAFIFLPPYVGEDIAMLTIFTVGILLVPLGFWNPYGMPFEKYLMLVMKYKIIRPRFRHVEYRDILNETIEKDFLELEEKYRNLSGKKGEKRKC